MPNIAIIKSSKGPTFPRTPPNAIKIEATE